MPSLKANINLQPFNTFNIKAKAANYLAFSSVESLNDYFQAYAELPFLVLGGGSNLLFKKDFPGTVLHNQILGIKTQDLAGDFVLVEAGAGENWHDFVQWCINQGFGGLENLSLIPGKVGAAPIQNIGAYGVELKDVFHSLTAYDIQNRKLIELDSKACDFGYRYSRFKGDWKGRFIITNVTFKLSTANHQLNTSYGAITKALAPKQTITIRSIADAVIQIRQSKLPDPIELGNAGSFFKNSIISQEEFDKIQAKYPSIPNYTAGGKYVKVPAGWLIDQCGWKGKRFGSTGCYEKQALVIVNYGAATGQEIWAFAQQLIASVEEKFGITLEPEVNVIGD
ncbi:MAG: UDP-N-acetylmuramate dehydrogenase [Saprospiraceae bacterium]